jgi:hypothetical protein
MQKNYHFNIFIMKATILDTHSRTDFKLYRKNDGNWTVALSLLIIFLIFSSFGNFPLSISNGADTFVRERERQRGGVSLWPLVGHPLRRDPGGEYFVQMSNFIFFFLVNIFESHSLKGYFKQRFKIIAQSVKSFKYYVTPFGTFLTPGPHSFWHFFSMRTNNFGLQFLKWFWQYSVLKCLTFKQEFFSPIAK